MKYPNFFTILMLSLFVALATYQHAHCDESPVGEINKKTGEVSIERSDGKKVRGEEGLPLFSGDSVITEKGGMVWFSLLQGRQFRLGEDAQISIDELSGPEVEDNQPILRLVLGYLWSKIQKIKGKPSKLDIHTPTAVLGVRGTEFDTVVSLDATSIITVDEGVIEVDVEDQKLVLGKDKMTQLEVDIKPSLPTKAIPKEKRDWKEWRKARIKQLFKKLPQKAPKFRKRFEKMVERSTRFTTKVKEASERLSAEIQRVRMAKREKDRKKFVQSLRQLKQDVSRFKRMVAKFRRRMNHVRVMGKLSHRIEKFVSNNRERFTDQELVRIHFNLAVISQKRVQLRDIFRQSIFEIRRTFKELKELRREIRRGGRR